MNVCTKTFGRNDILRSNFGNEENQQHKFNKTTSQWLSKQTHHIFIDSLQKDLHIQPLKGKYNNNLTEGEKLRKI